MKNTINQKIKELEAIERIRNEVMEETIKEAKEKLQSKYEKWDFNHQWGEYLIKELGLDDYLGLREYVKKEFTSLLAGFTKKV